MDNISKVVGVDTTLGEKYRQAAYKRLERAKAEGTKESFSDIYDVRLLSAELNRSSADFKAVMMDEAKSELNRVITNLGDMEKAEEVLASYPSDDIIALTKLAAKNRTP